MIGIVILNYNSFNDADICIKSILKNSLIHYKIYVIDNFSKDNSYALLCQKYGQLSNIKFISNPENYGYAKGNNIGISLAIEDKCDYILLANPDIIFTKNSIKILTEAFKDDKIGLTCPKILDSNFNEAFIHILCPTKAKEKYLVRTVLKMLNLRGVVDAYYGKNINRSISYKVFAPSGCCFCAHRRIFDFIFPLDENTFLYSEEYIIGTKAIKSNLNLVCETSSIVIHNHKNVTTNSINYIYALSSEIYYLRTYVNQPFIWFIPLIFYRVLGYFIRTLYLRDYRNNINMFLRMLKKCMLN